jgi:hypothetical protein
MKYVFADKARSFSHQTLFHPQSISVIRPHHVLAFLQNWAYGKTPVDYNDRKNFQPKGCRASTLEQAKKAISHYMNQASMAWNGTTGNPTRDGSINRVIKEVQKAEVKGFRKPPQARQDLTENEFRCVLDFLVNMATFMHLVVVTCMCVLQFHLIGRGDGICHLKINQLEPHHDYDFALKLMVKWSKNVMDERGCPPQILLGACDPDFCVLLHLSLYLEYWIQLAMLVWGLMRPFSSPTMPIRRPGQPMPTAGTATLSGGCMSPPSFLL